MSDEPNAPDENWPPARREMVMDKTVRLDNEPGERPPVPPEPYIHPARRKQVQWRRHDTDRTVYPAAGLLGPGEVGPRDMLGTPWFFHDTTHGRAESHAPLVRDYARLTVEEAEARARRDDDADLAPLLRTFPKTERAKASWSIRVRRLR